MEDLKKNKSYTPSQNKTVKIKFKANRASEGIAQDANGYAVVDVVTAERLVSKGFAEYVTEPQPPPSLPQMGERNLGEENYEKENKK